MPGDWKGAFSRRLQRRASDRGRRMANKRWELVRARRSKLAALTAEQYPNAIVRRIVVIYNEREVREAVIFSFDTPASARRKLNSVLQR